VVSVSIPALIMGKSDHRDECTWELCGLDGAFFAYRPSRAANITFTVCFGVAMLAYLVLGIRAGKKWMYYTFSMVFGCALEVIGYVARILAYDDIYHDVRHTVLLVLENQAKIIQGPFLAQVICLTIAPAFLAAGIYLCLEHIVRAVGPKNSRIPPHLYPRIFIPCDVLSLILQAAGGGYASIMEQNDEDPVIGNHIMLAGLAWQVFTLLMFMLLAADFAMRTYFSRRKQKAQDQILPSRAVMTKIWMFRCFLVALSLATVLVFARCVYRVVELSQGWSGHLIGVERYFIVLEGAVVLAAVILLFMFYPGVCIDDNVAELARSERPHGSEGDGEHMWYRLRRTVTTEEVLESRVGFRSRNEKLSPAGNTTTEGFSIH
jgi:hypothetical protein